MSDESDRCQRWRKIAIDQLGYALNLILTFTIATLGYWFVLLKDKDFIPSPSAKCAMLLSLSTLSLSAICGLLCVLNRLSDFRGTAKRACKQTGAPTQDGLRGLGRRTWGLFYVQLATFALGVAALVITLLITYGRKLV